MIRVLLIPFAYLLGSLSSAIIVCRLMGLPDPRTEGSHNPGATNVLRLGGKKAAAITLLGDSVKGLVPVLLAQVLDAPPLVLAIVGLAAFLGHLYPLFFRFQGGKGVATFIGVTLGLHWLLGLGVIGTWLLIARVYHISSLAALIAAILAPIYAWGIGLAPVISITIALMTLMLLWRHRTNIQRILSGEEGKIGRS
jgi:glycerol-3-phosphate acyltransferase PlsY